MKPSVPPSAPTKPELVLWFYANGNAEPIGPVSFDELRRLAVVGTISAETFVIAEGETEWRKLQTVITPTSVSPPAAASVARGTQRKSWLAQKGPIVVVSMLGVLFVLGSVLRLLGPKHPEIEAKHLDTEATPSTSSETPKSNTPVGNGHVKADVRKTYRAADFLRVFNGGNGMFINDVGVENLADMVEAIYAGTISQGQASRYAFRPSANEGVLRKIVDGYLIFEVSPQGERTVEFAMRRDPAFEREQVGPGNRYATVQEYYEDQFGAEVSSDGPLARGPVMIVGMTQFVTRRRLPGA